MTRVTRAHKTTAPAPHGAVQGEAVETGGMRVPATAPASPATFMLADLPADLAKVANAASDRIGAIHRRSVEGFAQIGREIIAVQEKLERGYFVKWLDTLPIARSSAYRAVEMAKNLGHELPTVGNMPLTIAQKLAAAPEPVRIEILTELKSDDPPAARDIDQRLWQAKADAKQFEREALLTPDQRKQKAMRDKAQRLRQQRDHEKWRAEQDERMEQRAAAMTRVAEILVPLLSEDALTEVVDLLRRYNTHDLDRVLAARLQQSNQ